VKLKRLFIIGILLFIPSLLLADQYSVEMFVLGDAAFITHTLNAVAMLTTLDPDSDIGKMVNLTIETSFAIGIIYSGRWMAVGDVKKSAYEIVWIVALMAGFLKGNTTVFVYDDRSSSATYGDSYKVANIPLALAEMMQLSTNLANSFAKIMDTAMAPVDDSAKGQFTKVGYGNNMKLITDFIMMSSKGYK
jgi:hypothetical protein